MNTTRVFSIFALAIAVALLMPMLVHAVNMQIIGITIDGQQIDPSNENSTAYLEVQRGQDLPITVRVQALADVHNAQVEASIFGYRYSVNDENKVYDISPTFDLGQDGYTFKSVKLQVPTLIDKDYFKLRIRVADENSVSFEQVFNLRVVGVDAAHAVEIKDYSFSPQQVMSGRAFTAQVQVRNIGDHDLQDLKATVSLPELGIQDTEYLDTLNQETSKTFEKLLLRIPECAKPGTYNVDMEVNFDNYESTTTSSQITITQDPACPGGTGTGTGTGTQGSSTTIVRVPGSQEVAPGATAVFPVMIQNSGTTPKSYVITVSGAAFGTTRVDPSSLIVVNAGDVKTAYVYLTVNPDEVPAQKVFAVTIDSDGDSKQIPLTATITAGQQASQSSSSMSLSGVKSGLEIGLVILVIVLIVIGLVLGFTRLKDPKKGAGSGPGSTEPEPYY